jgi:hypothetical protein
MTLAAGSVDDIQAQDTAHGGELAVDVPHAGAPAAAPANLNTPPAGGAENATATPQEAAVSIENPPGVVSQYVTLGQMAAMVQRSKRTLENWKARKINPLPPPDIDGGGGKPDEWDWSKIRPWLQNESGRTLPERFPTLHPPLTETNRN